MKFRILLVLITLIICSCGKSKKEIEQEKQEIKLQEIKLLEMHAQKVEVGKSKLNIQLTNQLEQLRKNLKKERKKLKEINKFKFGRSKAAKKKQIKEQSNRIDKIRDYINRIEAFIPKLHLKKRLIFKILLKN